MRQTQGTIAASGQHVVRDRHPSSMSRAASRSLSTFALSRIAASLLHDHERHGDDVAALRESLMSPAVVNVLPHEGLHIVGEQMPERDDRRRAPLEPPPEAGPSAGSKGPRMVKSIESCSRK
jgi:hypothetical protein